MGKSELILRFQRDKPARYFLGKKASAELQIREFLEVAGRELKDPLLTAFPAHDWKTALEVVIDRWPSDKKLVPVLDEFQWMVESSPELPGKLPKDGIYRYSLKNLYALPG